MAGKTNTPRGILISAALLALGVSGCVQRTASADAAPPPRMPQILPAKPTAGAPAVSKADILATALRRANDADIPGALRALDAIEDRAERSASRREFVASLANDDPSRAVQVVLALPPGMAQADALESAARTLVRRDPDTALQWALGLPEATPRFAALQVIADHFIRDNPRGALDRVAALPDHPRRDEALVLTGARWARRDAGPALAWARALTEGELKTRALTSIGFELAQSIPDQAIAVAETLPEGRNRWLLLAAATQTWVARDPNAALKWARQLPAGAARDTALAAAETSLAGPPRYPSVPRDGTQRGRPSIGGRIAGAVPGDGTELASLAPGPERDDALRKKFEQLLLMSPALAADWLGGLAPAERRDEMVDRLIREWLPQNPTAAETWIDQTIIQPDRKRELLRDWRR